MKILKIIVIVIVVLIALLLIVALFVKKEYNIERTIVINKPKADVYNYVSHIKNQIHYNVWVQADPNMKQEFIGTDGTVGFINSWNGNDKAGEGQQEIINLIPNERVDLQLKFIRPFKDTMNGSTITKDTLNGSTKVTSVVNGVNSYPKNLMNLFLDGMLGKDMDTNLNNLKTILEKQ